MKLCEICQREIPTDRTSNNVKYCGLKCARKAEARQNIDRINNRAQRINAIAHLAYRAYGYKCAICGWQATDSLIAVKGNMQHAYGNELHHIIPASEGGEEKPDNIILLCPNHHKQADMEIISRKDLRQHTRSFDIDPEERHKAIVACADAIADLIFD